MANENMVQGALGQVAPNPNGDVIQGVLQGLLQQHSPEAYQRRQEEQASARQGVMDAMARPVGGEDRTFADYLMEAPGLAGSQRQTSDAITHAVQSKGRDAELNRLREIDRAKYLAGELGKDSKLDVNELGVMARMLKPAGAGGQSTVTKMDKDGNMVNYNPSTGETKIVHSSQRGEYQRIWTKAYEKAVAEQMDNPEQYAHGVAANVLGTSAPGTATSGAPSGSGASPDSAQQSSSIKYEDKAEKERRKEFASGLEKGAIKDYEENVKPQAAVADSMLNTIGMLRQIPRTQDAFAPWREKLGAGLQAIGADGSMVREAENLQQVRPLLAKIANDRLLAAKGVQTEGDAQRAYNEFMKITDTQKAADFMYAWTEELANRNKFKKSVYEDSAQTEGTMVKAGKAWENTDYQQAAPVAILNGKPWTYTKWRDSFLKSNPDVPLNETLKIWNKLARGEK